MKRYQTDVRDGALYLEHDDGWVEIGAMTDICRLLGGETYSIEYDERQRTMDWLDTDSEGKLTFDVRETVAEMDYTNEFVGTFTAIDGDAADDDGFPLRASVFADRMAEIWDAKGALDHA